MVTIRGLKKSYKGFRVLDGLDMTIAKGDVYGFLGKNGCGKTTTMNIICNVIPKDEGEIRLGEAEGEPIKIGYLPESPALFGYMNGIEYLEYVAGCARYTGDVRKRIAEVLEITGMSEGGKRRIKGYSRGMNQRMGIAATIFDKPDLIILDEPTSALDPQGRAEVIGIIQNLTATGATILLCTHILTDVERVANRIGILKNGRLAVEDSISDIMKKHSTASVEVYLENFTDETAALLGSLDFVTAAQNFPASGMVALDVSDPEEGMYQTMRFLSEKRIAAARVSLTRPTLEQIYLETISDGQPAGRGNA